MPKITQTRIGSVFLKEITPRKWRASWTDPLTKRHVRRILPAATFRQAEAQAKEINSYLAQGRGFGGKLRGSGGHSISDAVLESIKHSSASERVRRNYTSDFNALARYLEAYAPGIKAWSDLTEPILENYLAHCREDGIAHDTTVARFRVLKLTGNYMERTYKVRNAVSLVRVRRTDPPKSQVDEHEMILSPLQLRGLLDWLRENAPLVYVWAVAQGLGGLRVYEIAYLTEQAFDSEAQTIRITATEAHKPKTRHSYRVVPVCDAIAETLREWISNLTVRHSLGFLFLPERAPMGRQVAKSPQARIGVYTPSTIQHHWANALAEARGQGIDIPDRFIPRKLRATFCSAMRTAGVDLECLQVYIGHRPETLLAQRYDPVGVDRLRSIARMSQHLYELSGPFAEGVKDTIKTGGLLH